MFKKYVKTPFNLRSPWGHAFLALSIVLGASACKDGTVQEPASPEPAEQASKPVPQGRFSGSGEASGPSVRPNGFGSDSEISDSSQPSNFASDEAEPETPLAEEILTEDAIRDFLVRPLVKPVKAEVVEDGKIVEKEVSFDEAKAEFPTLEKFNGLWVYMDPKTELPVVLNLGGAGLEMGGNMFTSFFYPVNNGALRRLSKLLVSADSKKEKLNPHGKLTTLKFLARAFERAHLPQKYEGAGEDDRSYAMLAAIGYMEAIAKENGGHLNDMTFEEFDFYLSAHICTAK
jgi:hypothetical protein